MERVLGRRIGQLIIVLFLASIAVWAMVYMLPGDAAQAIAGPTATQAQLDAARERLGLDEPIVSQYATWLSHALQGDFGTSAQNNFSVSSIIGERLPATLQLTLISMLLAMLISIPIGVFAGTRPNSRFTSLIHGYCSLTLAVPSFWAAILFVLAFSRGTGLGWFPAISQYENVLTSPFVALNNLAGPVTVLALLLSGILTRFITDSVSAVANTEYVRTARAKGVRGARLMLRHILRNAALPVVTIFGLQLASVLGGVVVIEAVFNYPGLGLLSLQAVEQRDYPMIQAMMLLAVAFFVIVNLLVDLLYAAIDPRVKVSAA
ncbi:peptide ABC transporter permease [Amycolatopsis deserti]|uniref:Peptide ABC transporter permease n=1 Tax=Amycolatopsis deserti TaxID=185696 RepID=A0ABQ3IYZ0_9PSEU|nr:ABC transporter permease [Amycolatopsis deserti]GHE98734.1 peptide ABC transporter permease [Amycolatopsis deserti]